MSKKQKMRWPKLSDILLLFIEDATFGICFFLCDKNSSLVEINNNKEETCNNVYNVGLANDWLVWKGQ